MAVHLALIEVSPDTTQMTQNTQDTGHGVGQDRTAHATQDMAEQDRQDTRHKQDTGHKHDKARDETQGKGQCSMGESRAMQDICQ